MPVIYGSATTQFRRNLVRLTIVVLSAVLILAGCGTGTSNDSDDEGHRFATEKRPTQAPTATSAVIEATPVETSVPQPTVAPGSFLVVRGAPQLAYFLIDGMIQVYDTGARTFTPLAVPDGFRMMDFSSSPTGDRVGVLGTLNGQTIVQFYGGDGEPLGDPITLQVPAIQPVPSPIATPGATPATTNDVYRFQINWIPQGNGVVVSGPGVLKRVSMSGTVMPLSRTGVAGAVVDALWSPMDSQLAILAQTADGRQGVYMLDSGNAESNELVVMQMEPNQRLSNVQWLPNGLGMLVVVGNDDRGDLTNGQIYVYRFDAEAPVLIATSGQGGPGATITHAVVSPDGHAVAYAVTVRDQNAWHLHSLWVKPLRGGPAVQIPTTSSSPITNLVWTAEGLVWQQEDGGLFVVDSSMTPRPLGEAPIATPVATPQSTPVPEPTPIG